MLAGPVSISTRPTAQQGCFSVKPQDSDESLLKVSIRSLTYRPPRCQPFQLGLLQHIDTKLLDSVSNSSMNRRHGYRIEFIRMLAFTKANARIFSIGTSLSAWCGF